jgi:hypothetical protein
MPTLRISPDSRYKDTNVYDEGGVVEFALWEPPAEFVTTDRRTRLHRVSQNEVGFLDVIAFQEWGSGFESLWWIIAQANAIINPETEMYAGQSLVIPPREDVVAFRARVGLSSV